MCEAYTWVQKGTIKKLEETTSKDSMVLRICAYFKLRHWKKLTSSQGWLEHSDALVYTQCISQGSSEKWATNGRYICVCVCVCVCLCAHAHEYEERDWQRERINSCDCGCWKYREEGLLSKWRIFREGWQAGDQRRVDVAAQVWRQSGGLIPSLSGNFRLFLFRPTHNIKGNLL